MLRQSHRHRKVEWNGVTFNIFTGAEGEALATFRQHALSICETPGESLISVNGNPAYRRRWKRATAFHAKTESMWFHPQMRFDWVSVMIPDAVFASAIGVDDVKDIDFHTVSTIDEDMLLKPSMLLAYLARHHDLQENALLVEQLIATIAAEVVRRLGSARQQHLVENIHGMPAQRLQMVLDYINDCLTQPIRLRDLADLAGMSECHFSRSFAKATGLPPSRYIMERRIERAKELLRGKQNLVEVALDSGFCSQSHFTTAFKESTGFTPAKFRAALVGVIKSTASALILKATSMKFILMLGMLVNVAS